MGLSEKKNLFLGVLLTLLSCFSLAAISTVVKMMNQAIHPFQVLLIQNLFGLVVMASICLSIQKSFRFLHAKRYGLLFIRSLAGLSAFFFVFISLQYVSVADANLLLNTAPFFVPLIFFFLFKEKINPKVWFGIVPGFIGILLILHPEGNLFKWQSFYPLISGVAVATIYVSLRRLHFHGESSLSILFYLFLFATLMTIPGGAYMWKAPSLTEWGLLALAAVASFLAQTTATVSLRYASPIALAPLSYSSVLFALLFDWLFWHLLPSWISFCGMALVVVGGVIDLSIANRAKEGH